MRGLQAARGASLSTDDSSTGDRSTGDRSADSSSADSSTAGSAPVQPAAGAATLPRRRAGLLALVAVAVLALDVASKALVVAELEGQRVLRLLGGGLLIAVSRNPGAAFSFAEGATVVFTAVALAVVVVILRSARRLRSAGWAWSLGLLLGGATGNLLDRLFRAPGFARGAVVDFIDFRVWPVFNLADSAICVGGALAVLLSLRGVELDGTRGGRDEGERAASGTMEP